MRSNTTVHRSRPSIYQRVPEGTLRNKVFMREWTPTWCRVPQLPWGWPWRWAGWPLTMWTGLMGGAGVHLQMGGGGCSRRRHCNTACFSSVWNIIFLIKALQHRRRGNKSSFFWSLHRQEGVGERVRVKGYIRMPPDLEPMARIFCTGSKAKAVGW